MKLKHFLTILFDKKKSKNATSCLDVKGKGKASVQVKEDTLFCEAQKNESVSIQSKQTLSLLDNTAFMALAEQCCKMYEELDRMQSQVNDPLILDFIDMQKSRIREALVFSGALMIDGETEFNLLRHVPTIPSFVDNGTPITSTSEQGITLEERVMIKAKVNI